MLVDMHAHVVPDELALVSRMASAPKPPYVERAVDDSTARVLVSEQMRFRASSIWFSAEQRLEAMEKHGVDVEVISPIPALLDYTLAPSDGRELSRRVNDFVLQLCESSANRFFGFGLVPIQDPDLAARELPALVQSGLRGIEVSSNVNGISIGDRQFWEFFSEVERLGLAVFVHALNPTMGERMPPAVAGTYALTVEQTVAVTSVATGGLTESCPNLRLAFSHGGGGFAALVPRAHFFWARTWNEEAPADRPVGNDGFPLPSPFEQARRYYYDGLTFDHRALRLAIDMLGASRILVGTDFPAIEREEPVGRTLRSMGLPDAVVEQISWTNCFEFLGVRPPVI